MDTLEILAEQVEIRKSNILTGFKSGTTEEVVELSEVDFNKAVIFYGLEVYEKPALNKFKENLQKAFDINQDSEMLEKAKKDLSKLVKVHKVDKTGKRITVWVKPKEAEAVKKKEIGEVDKVKKELNQLIEFRNKQDVGSKEYNKYGERITNLKNKLVELSKKPKEPKKEAKKEPKKESINGLDKFREIIRESDNVDEAMNKVKEIKNVPKETSDYFLEKYGEGGKLTMKQAFTKLYDEVKKEEPKKEEKKETDSEYQKRRTNFIQNRIRLGQDRKSAAEAFERKEKEPKKDLKKVLDVRNVDSIKKAQYTKIKEKVGDRGGAAPPNPLPAMTEDEKKPFDKGKKKETAPSLKPPKGWWSDRISDAKKQYPNKTEEQRMNIVGGIWQNYDEEAKKKIREDEGKTYGKAPEKGEKLAKAEELLGFEKAEKEEHKWKHKDAKAYADIMTKEYGEPTKSGEGFSIWEKKIGKIFKTKVKDESITHNFPKPHKDFVYSYMLLTDAEVKNMKDLIDDFTKITGSIFFDALKKEAGARCGMIEKNAITLGFIEDGLKDSKIITKEEYAKRINNNTIPNWFKPKKEKEIKKAFETLGV